MKPQAVDPGATSRTEAFALWMDAPNPMVTFFKTLDVTPLVRLSRWKGLKFNMLLCWCIGSAASRVKEFYLLPVGKELLRYDTLAVNTIVKNRLGEVSSCDVPYSEDLARFNSDYLRLTKQVTESCENHDLTESMVIGTSAIIDTELDGAVLHLVAGKEDSDGHRDYPQRRKRHTPVKCEEAKRYKHCRDKRTEQAGNEV